MGTNDRKMSKDGRASHAYFLEHVGSTRVGVEVPGLGLVTEQLIITLGKLMVSLGPPFLVFVQVLWHNHIHHNVSSNVSSNSSNVSSNSIECTNFNDCGFCSFFHGKFQRCNVSVNVTASQAFFGI